MIGKVGREGRVRKVATERDMKGRRWGITNERETSKLCRKIRKRKVKKYRSYGTVLSEQEQIKKEGERTDERETGISSTEERKH